MTTTQSDINNMSAGDELNERFCLAIEYFLAWGRPWCPPTSEDRLRRLMGLPPPHPSIGNPSEYCGPDWCSADTDAIEDVFTDCGKTYPQQPESVAMVKWLITEAMEALGMD